MYTLPPPRATAPESLEAAGLGPFPLEGLVERILARPAPAGWQPTGWTRSRYLDLAERIVTTAAQWQNEDGAIIDPVLGREWGQTTSRFASSGALLLSFDRLPQVQPGVELAMDWVCSRLPAGRMDSPDFQTREIMTAYICLKGRSRADRLSQWADGIRAIVPDEVYRFISPNGVGIEKLHNWNLYLCAGESMRQREGLSSPEGILWGDALFDYYVPVQLREHFTPYGMYRDPNDPITYDIQSRLQLATALAYGYQGPWADTIGEVLRRGALTTLLFLTPDGLVPFGGRSDQFHFREVAVSVLCEMEASRYKENNPALSGAFKRQAHCSTRSVLRWLDEMEPFRHLKNSFDPGQNWGLDHYGYYSVYSLLAASLLGQAALFADDTIEEAPCPAEIGGFAFALQPAFHKVFANIGGTYAAFDTAADPHHNATGLGSLQRAGAPTEIALAMPFSAAPDYNLPAEFVPDRPAAIGPAWLAGQRWISLAEQDGECTAHFEPLLDAPGTQQFLIRYHHPSAIVTETCSLAAGRLSITAEVEMEQELLVQRMRFTVPLLVSSGEERAVITEQPGCTQVNYRGSVYSVRYDPILNAWIEPKVIGNRNGLYRLLVIEVKGTAVSVDLTIEP